MACQLQVPHVDPDELGDQLQAAVRAAASTKPLPSAPSSPPTVTRHPVLGWSGDTDGPVVC
jgi:hypothetical protein